MYMKRATALRAMARGFIWSSGFALVACGGDVMDAPPARDPAPASEVAARADKALGTLLPCAGIADGTSPLGCDGVFGCLQRECREQRCVSTIVPGLRCGPLVPPGAWYPCEGTCSTDEGEGSRKPR
jgi:hypothetical protein